MIVAGRAGHTNANDDDAHERRIGQRHAKAMKVVCGVEGQLVDAGFESIGGDERLIRPAVGIGRDPAALIADLVAAVAAVAVCAWMF